MRYSAETEQAPRKVVEKAFLNLMKRSHIKGDKIIVEERKAAKKIDDVSGVHLRSPSRIASNVVRFRLFWRMGDRAMNNKEKAGVSALQIMDAALRRQPFCVLLFWEICPTMEKKTLGMLR
ncbi:MAG: hypothetical protein SO362_05395 [Selenomonas montiformis]|nr:hypothetical protein [Selenomonas montiformis]